MSNMKEPDSGRVEWRITVDRNRSEVLAPESSLVKDFILSVKSLIVNWFIRVWTFLKKAWQIGNDDPRKVIHCLRVGIALTVVSLFYYTRPLYEGVGGNAMWAVMTVVVVFEYTVGASIYKCLNRILGTCLAGFLAVGIHWLASRSGDKIEPFIMGALVFLLASAATFSRFIPVVKARFDYGAMIFILTFTIVSLSGYRVEKLLSMAHERLSTIIIGTSLCILSIMLVFPVWAGEELHFLISRNMTKLANSLDCCVNVYFDDSNIGNSDSKASNETLLAYKCVLNSKATEESMANFARWEPPHGSFSYHHPWRQYLKIGAAMRNCAYCLEALNSCINNNKQVSKLMNKKFSDICRSVNSSTSCILRELAQNLETVNKSSKIELSKEEMKGAVQDLKACLRSNPTFCIPPMDSKTNSPGDHTQEVVFTTKKLALAEIIPLVTFASLLTETSSRVEEIVDTVQELAEMAKFKPLAADKQKQDQHNPNSKSDEQEKDEKTMKTLESV